MIQADEGTEESGVSWRCTKAGRKLQGSTCHRPSQDAGKCTFDVGQLHSDGPEVRQMLTGTCENAQEVTTAGYCSYRKVYTVSGCRQLP